MQRHAKPCLAAGRQSSAVSSRLECPRLPESLFIDHRRFALAPPQEIRAADIPDFAGAHDLIEGRHLFLNGRIAILSVELEQVDMFNTEALQSLVDRLNQMLAR